MQPIPITQRCDKVWVETFTRWDQEILSSLGVFVGKLYCNLCPDVLPAEPAFLHVGISEQNPYRPHLEVEAFEMLKLILFPFSEDIVLLWSHKSLKGAEATFQCTVVGLMIRYLF